MKHNDYPYEYPSFFNQRSKKSKTEKNELWNAYEDLLKSMNSENIYQVNQCLQRMQRKKLSISLRWYDLNGDKLNALHWAIEKGMTKIIGTLLDHGIPPTDRTASNELNAAHLALMNRQVETLKTLFKKDELLYLYRTTDNKTLLHLTVELNSAECFDLLMEFYNKDKNYINATDADGNTTLHLAVQKEKEYYIKKLLENGADCTLTNNQKKIPEQCSKDLRILKIFNDHLPNSTTSVKTDSNEIARLKAQIYDLQQENALLKERLLQLQPMNSQRIGMPPPNYVNPFSNYPYFSPMLFPFPQHMLPPIVQSPPAPMENAPKNN